MPCLIWVILVVCSITHAQPLETATLITPWPPEGWPEGAKGEVRLVVIDVDDGDLGISFPIGENGEITYRLPEDLPRQANKFYEPLSASDLMLCEGVSPIISPPDVGVIILEFRLYAKGEAWGVLEMSSMVQPDLFTIEAAFMPGVFYAREAFQVGGSGLCLEEDPTELIFDLDFQAGRNLMVVEIEGSLMGAVTTFTTREVLDLPGTPLKY